MKSLKYLIPHSGISKCKPHTERTQWASCIIRIDYLFIFIYPYSIEQDPPKRNTNALVLSPNTYQELLLRSCFPSNMSCFGSRVSSSAPRSASHLDGVVIGWAQGALLVYPLICSPSLLLIDWVTSVTFTEPLIHPRPRIGVRVTNA